MDLKFKQRCSQIEPKLREFDFHWFERKCECDQKFEATIPIFSPSGPGSGRCQILFKKEASRSIASVTSYFNRIASGDPTDMVAMAWPKGESDQVAFSYMHVWGSWRMWILPS